MLQTQYSAKLHGISRHTERNAFTEYGVGIDVIKTIESRKITCPVNVVQHIFIDYLSNNMIEWK